MKRIISMILAVILSVLSVVPSFAEYIRSTYELSDIIENHTAHSAEEIAEFKAELNEKGMLNCLLYPEVSSKVYVISNHETRRIANRRNLDVFNDEEVIMGIKKGNEFVTIPYSEYYEVTPENAENVLSYIWPLYGSREGQYCYLYFNDNAITFLNTLSYEEREAFMLEFYLSVMDTEEAIGLTYDKIYRGIMGDINGDGKINAVDSNALVSFVMGNQSAIVPQNCDLDNSGNINLKDNFLLKKLILGI